jgi:dihydroorotate dehydrogenase (fumarate)
MANLKTRYMGLELKNPIIAGASNLVTDIDNLKKMEENGVAAVVYKLFSKSRSILKILSFMSSGPSTKSGMLK